MRSVASALFLLVFVASAPLPAQAPPPIQPGTRVRVTTVHQPGLWKANGTCVAISADSILFAPSGGGGPLAIRFDSLARLDVTRGLRHNAVKGAIVGASIVFVSAQIGFVAGFFRCVEEDHPCPFLLAATMALLASPALPAGAIVGALIKTERWERVPLDGLRVRLAPQRDGRLGIGLSVAF